MSQFFIGLPGGGGGGNIPTSFQTDSGVAVPAANVLNVLGGVYSDTTGAGNTVTVISKTEAVWIVDSTASEGTQTTIAAALTAASSGDTIFIRPGTYTENITLKAGVSIIGWTGDRDIPTVTINGTCSYSAASSGVFNISNIRLQTNAAAAVSLSGTSSSTIFLNNCFINATGSATAISMTTSGATASIRLNNCTGNIAGASAALFTSSSAGSLIFMYCAFRNQASSTVANTVSAGSFSAAFCQFTAPITTSSTATLVAIMSDFNCLPINTTALTLGGTNATITGGTIAGGTASALSIGGALTLTDCAVNSSNTNAITGAGSITYSGLYFSSTSYTNNVTTQNLRVTNGGEYKGRTSNTVPSAGMLGEEVRSYLAEASGVSLTTATAANVTSISLTAGIWDVSGIVMFGGGPVTGTATGASIVTTTATTGTQGDNYITSPIVSTALDYGIAIPQYRLSLNATTTVYLTAIAIFTVGSVVAYGRISAVRVA